MENNQNEGNLNTKESDTTLNTDKTSSGIKIKPPERMLIFPILGTIQGMLVYFATFFSIFLLITSTTFTRTILIIILLYQFIFAKRSHMYRQYLKWMRPWEIFKSYDVKTHDTLEDHHSLFSFHPHGVMGFGPSMCAGLNDILYDAIFCASRAMANLPISGMFARWMGVQGVNHKNFKEIMNKGKNIIFIPGGFEEATLTEYNRDRVFINSRKGFIKYAIEYGYKIHPVYTFNENKLFYTVNWFEKLRLFLNKFKIPGTIFYSKYFMFPNHNFHILTAVGEGIQMPLIKNPTCEDVDKYHKIYIEKLVELYDKYKHEYGASEVLEVN